MTAGYRARVEEAVAAGWRFAGLHASERGRVVRALLVDGQGQLRLETALTNDGECASLVDLVPAAGWDEREAHDLHGIRFRGHQPLRPLVDHDQDLARWTVPVRGRDPYQVAVGPIHAGVIESGHFRFHVVGDRILHLDLRLFYKHRGLERAAEGQRLRDGLAYAARACAACTIANTLAYAHACEQALGLVPTVELSRARAALLELERVWNHLNDIAAVCAGVGFAAGNSRFAALTEQARSLNSELTGHRFLFGSVHVGGSELELSWDALRVARTRIEQLRHEFRTGWRALLFNFSLQDRLSGVGILRLEDAQMLGTVGPAARASGVADDARTEATRLAYDSFQPTLPERQDGDVRARLEQRADELEQSFALLDQLLARPIRPSTTNPAATEHAIGVGRIESARGATTCVVERNGDRVGRLRLRTGSYANWPSLAQAAATNLLPDFPLINKSFELCYACADR